jgi:hypothetical protein
MAILSRNPSDESLGYYRMSLRDRVAVQIKGCG